MQIAIPLFDRFTALDAVGPYEVLSRLPGAELHWVAAEPRPVRSDSRMLQLVADTTFEDIPSPDVIVFPGGWGTRPLLEDEAVLGWLREAHRTSTWTTSVCTGALVLGAAGVLDGLEATTHAGWPRCRWCRRATRRVPAPRSRPCPRARRRRPGGGGSGARCDPYRSPTRAARTYACLWTRPSGPR